MLDILVNQFVDANEESESTQMEWIQLIVDDISGSGGLLSLVEFLGPTLTSSDPVKRSRGLMLLAETTAIIDPSLISPQTAGVLLQFYLKRLEDPLSVESVLKGIERLLELQIVSKTEMLQIPGRIFAELNVQSFMQQVRQTVFRIIALLFQHNLAGLKRLGSEFVFGFIHSMDGEKDPRNLMIAFHLVRQIVMHLPFNEHTEDLFEGTFCYFPITFRPPPDDPYGVTAEELKTALRDILASTPEFAPYCIPLLLDKLSSDSAAARFDAMEAIAACMPVYGILPLASRLNEVWGILKKEVFEPAEAKNELCALTTIQAITKAAASATISSNRGSTLNIFVGLVLADCAKFVDDEELKYFKSASKTLAAVASAGGNQTCCKIIDCFVPKIIGKLHQTDQKPPDVKLIIDFVVDLLLAQKSVFNTSIAEDADLSSSNPLMKYKQELFDYFMSRSVSEGYVPIRTASLQALGVMVQSTGLIDTQETKMVVEVVKSWLLSNVEGEMLNVALSLLRPIFNFHPALVSEIIVGSLYSTIDACRATRDLSLLKKSLVAIEELFHIQQLQSELQARLSNNIIDVLSTQSDTESESFNQEYAHELLLNYKSILRHALNLSKYNVDIIVRLINSCVEGHKQKSVTTLSDNVVLVANVLSSMTQTLNTDEMNAVNTRLSKKTSLLTDHIPTNPIFAYLSAIVISNFDASVPLDFILETDGCVYITNVIDSGVELFVLGSGLLVASLVNKTECDVFLEMYAASVGDALLSDANEPVIRRRHAIAIYGYIAKALVIRSNEKGFLMTERLLSLLFDQEVSKDAADAIRTVIADDPNNLLSRKAHAKTKLLFKQKLFARCLPILAKGFYTSKDVCKVSHLYALSYLLQHVQKAALISEIDKVLPMVITSLQLTDPALKVTSLETLKAIVQDEPKTVSSQISTLVPLLMSISTFSNKTDQNNTPHARIAALGILGMLPSRIEYAVLHPFIGNVLRGLQVTLDDPKRVVRRCAANTRAIWCMPFSNE